MKQYILKEGIDKKLLINNGFIENGKNTMSFRKRVFEDAISLLIVIKFSQEEASCECRLMDNYLDKEYGAIQVDYGRNAMKEKVIQKYEYYMDELVKKGIFEEKINVEIFTYKINLKIDNKIMNEEVLHLEDSLLKNNLDTFLEKSLKEGEDFKNVELTVKAKGNIIENKKFLAKLNKGELQKIKIGR